MAGNYSRFGLIVFLAWLWAPAGWAQSAVVPPPPAVAASSYLLIDADTREVLVEHNIHQPLPPASLTKIMTAYIAEIEIEGGRVSLEDQVPISVKAWRTGGSRMFIREGTQVSLDDLLRGVIIQSGNDASVAIAEHVAGSESAFADMMNRQAKVLGMNNSHFKNSTGLPDDEHYTTAWDLAVLTQALIKHYPEHYAIYAERTFTFNGIDQPNRNRLLWRDRTVDGVKTGHTEAAGYCLVASAVRDDMRLISVVMGTDSDESRMRESQKLLSYGFRYFETQRVYEGGVPLKTARLWYGDRSQIELGAADNVHVTIPRGRYEDVEAELHVARVIEAPVEQGQAFGELRLKLDGKTVQKIPLVALQAVEQGNFFSRLLDAIHLFFRNLLADD
jgi:serine-type D-Ala-D-Ala carboxypeptidase (penicillin-binding protein 5/6)